MRTLHVKGRVSLLVHAAQRLHVSSLRRLHRSGMDRVNYYMARLSSCHVCACVCACGVRVRACARRLCACVLCIKKNLVHSLASRILQILQSFFRNNLIVAVTRRLVLGENPSKNIDALTFCAVFVLLNY